MNLNKFDTSERANVGEFLHLEHNGEKLYEDGEAVGLMVKGSMSADFKARVKRMSKDRTERLRLKKNGKVHGLGGQEREQQELYASAVCGYVRIEFDGKPLADEVATISQTVAIFEMLTWVQDQVMDFVDDDANYMGER